MKKGNIVALLLLGILVTSVLPTTMMLIFGDILWVVVPIIALIVACSIQLIKS